MLDSHQDWCHRKIAMLETVLAKIESYNSIIVKQAIKEVKNSGEHADDMFEFMEI